MSIGCDCGSRLRSPRASQVLSTRFPCSVHAGETRQKKKHSPTKFAQTISELFVQIVPPPHNPPKRRSEPPNYHYYPQMYCNTPICIGVLSVPLSAEERELLWVLLPVYIVVRLPFVSQWFWKILVVGFIRCPPKIRTLAERERERERERASLRKLFVQTVFVWEGVFWGWVPFPQDLALARPIPAIAI